MWGSYGVIRGHLGSVGSCRVIWGHLEVGVFVGSNRVRWGDVGQLWGDMG